MSTYVSLEREEYDHLMRMKAVAMNQAETIDMVLDFIENNSDTFDNKTVYFHRLDPEKLVNIFRYRMPEEWQELEHAVIEREIRKANGDD